MGRGLPDTFQTKYFQPLGARWQASEQLRGLIEVRELNLIDEWQQLPRFDLVLLRNVLFYFSPSTKETIVRRIDAEALKPSGELILGATERPLS